jgi:putative flippase GtrA
MGQVPEERAVAMAVDHEVCDRTLPITSARAPGTSRPEDGPGRQRTAGERRAQGGAPRECAGDSIGTCREHRAERPSEPTMADALRCATSLVTALPLAPPVLDVVVPVHNEEAGLESSLRRLHQYLTSSFPYSFRITVAENASTDRTVEVGRRVAAELPGIDVLVLADPGRGRALRTAWLASDATVLAYMDVDLSTDLAALLPLVAPLISGHSDVAIGSRLSSSSRVVRGVKREVISRSYNLLLRGALGTSLPDAQCGFKAIRAEVADQLLPLVEDDGWFFDTELLFLAERIGLRIHEVPVDWVDDLDSRVDIIRTARADLAGIVRLLHGRAAGRPAVAELRARIGRQPLVGAPSGAGGGTAGQLAVFAVLGTLSTVAYSVLFVLLRSVGSAQVANLVALLVTGVANTAANRRLTFGVRGREGAGRAQLLGLLVFALGLALTSGSLALLHAATVRPTRAAEVAVLLLASAAATVLRFVLLRSWIFRAGHGASVAPRPWVGGVAGAPGTQRPAGLPSTLTVPRLAG